MDLGPHPDRVWVHVDRVLIALTLTPFEGIGIGLAHPPYFPPGQGFH
jgi:hypothetical protein